MSLRYGRSDPHVAAVEWGARAATRRLQLHPAYMRRRRRRRRRPGPAGFVASLPEVVLCALCSACTCGCQVPRARRPGGTRRAWRPPGGQLAASNRGSPRRRRLNFTGRRIGSRGDIACRAWTRHRPRARRRRRMVIVQCFYKFVPTCSPSIHTACMCACMHAGRPWSYVHARGSETCRS